MYVITDLLQASWLGAERNREAHTAAAVSVELVSVENATAPA